jgi:hypothetical protein
MTRRSSTVVAMLALTVLPVGTATACDGPPAAPGVAGVASGPPRPGTVRPSLTEEQMAVNFVRCVRDEGLEIADPQRSVKGGFTVPLPEPPAGVDWPEPVDGKRAVPSRNIRDIPNVVAALRECRASLKIVHRGPARPPGPSRDRLSAIRPCRAITPA